MVLLLMGVVGSGKTTIGTLLAQQLGWEFVDADSFHSKANIEKIRRAIPLDEADRAPWLDAIHKAVKGWVAERRNVVLACSALKRAYRERIDGGPDVRLVYLKGSPDLISQRLRARRGHFANEQLLASQFAILEEPEEAITVDTSQSPPDIAKEIRVALGLA